jgi:hypothetical protein
MSHIISHIRLLLLNGESLSEELNFELLGQFWGNGFPQGVQDKILDLATQPGAATSYYLRLVSKYWMRSHDRQVKFLRLFVPLAFKHQLTAGSTSSKAKFDRGNKYAKPWEVESLRKFRNLEDLFCVLDVTSFDMPQDLVGNHEFFANHMCPYWFVYSLRGSFPHLKYLDVMIFDETLRCLWDKDGAARTADHRSCMYLGMRASKCAVFINTLENLHTILFDPDVNMFAEFIKALPKFFGTQLQAFHLPTINMVTMAPHALTRRGQSVGPVFTIPQMLSVCAASRVSICITFLAFETDVRFLQRNVLKDADWTILSISEEEAHSTTWGTMHEYVMLLWSLTFAAHL